MTSYLPKYGSKSQPSASRTLNLDTKPKPAWVQKEVQNRAWDREDAATALQANWRTKLGKKEGQ